MGKKDVSPLWLFLHDPGTNSPSTSVSIEPAGVYNVAADGLLLMKLCKRTHARVILHTFSGSKIIGRLKTRNTDAIIPKTFSTTRRARDNRYPKVLFSHGYQNMASSCGDSRRKLRHQ